MNNEFLVLVVLPNLFRELSRDLNSESRGRETGLILRDWVRVVRGRNLENLELFVVVVVVASVTVLRFWDLNRVRVLDLEGSVDCSNLEDARVRDLLLLV